MRRRHAIGQYQALELIENAQKSDAVFAQGPGKAVLKCGPHRGRSDSPRLEPPFNRHEQFRGSFGGCLDGLQGEVESRRIPRARAFGPDFVTSTDGSSPAGLFAIFRVSTT